ncbi:hypothetical protein ACVSQB_32985 [Bradyrhizobium elkanii]
MSWTSEQPTHHGVVVQWKQHKTNRRYWGFVERTDGAWIWFGENALANEIDRTTFGKGDLVRFVLFPEQREGHRPAACRIWLVKSAQENEERDVA